MNRHRSETTSRRAGRSRTLVRLAALPSRRRWPAVCLLVLVLGGLGGCGSEASAAEVERLVEALALEPGMTVADVGAGDGDFALALAAVVGETGRVLATEVEQDKVEEIRRRVEKQGPANVSVVLASQDDTGLPAGCCDAVLLRLVYHHFQRPEAMRAGLLAALAPGGRIAVVDIVPQTGWPELSGVPDRGGHGIPVDDLVAEMSSAGFEELARYEDWNGDEERFCIVFRRRSAAGR